MNNNAALAALDELHAALRQHYGEKAAAETMLRLRDQLVSSTDNPDSPIKVHLGLPEPVPPAIGHAVDRIQRAAAGD